LVFIISSTAFANSNARRMPKTKPYFELKKWVFTQQKGFL